METKEKPGKETLDQWHKDPSNWKLGVLYFNKRDKRIFPPKRFKAMGWTVNFANPFSYLTLLGIIILFLVIAKYAQ
jgi:uncharacterized membrane protein